MKKRVLLNIGSGSITPANWVNTDISWHPTLKKLKDLFRIFTFQLIRRSDSKKNVVYMNLNRQWKFATDSVDVVYASHVLEHLETSTRKLFFKEAARVLKTGGGLRIVVPDFYQLCCRYVNSVSSGHEDAIDSILYWMNLHRDNLYGQERNFVRKVYDMVQGYPHQHKVMFDRHLLIKQLSVKKWDVPKMETYGKSSLIAEIKDVEHSDEICPSLYIECALKEE